MLRCRSGYSFRVAVGQLEGVVDRVKAIGWDHFPMTDRASTFGYVRMVELCKKKGLRPVFGVELAVTRSINAKKPAVDHWVFLAHDRLKPIHDLIALATSQFHYEPLLTVDQAVEAAGTVSVVIGHRSEIEAIPAKEGLFLGLGPAVTKGYLRRGLEAGHKVVAVGDNKYTLEGDEGFYETVCGRSASTQSYSQWILSDSEWSEAVGQIADAELQAEAVANARGVLEISTAMLKPAEMVHPERKMTLRAMCEEGAQKLGCDLTRPEYAERLDRELNLIEEKNFEDYFQLVAQTMQWARQRLLCGPARGSSSGSLVCYLTEITSIDPIPPGLIFERFISVNRPDLPDIDLDFESTKRDQVFTYFEETYGKDHVARLGTVAFYQPRSSLKEAGGSLGIPPWKISPVQDAIIERSSGDSRALQEMEDTLKDTPAGRALLVEYPEIMVAAKMSGHPRHYSQHAAGIVITDKPVAEYVAVDGRTGATFCDKIDAEKLQLLKIDALGLTQLSICADALELAGLDRNHLFTLPLDDQQAFDVLNHKKYAGIFQYEGLALQSICDQVEIRELNDIVAITALARPGPLNTGGTNSWIKIKTGREPETYPHPIFEPYLKDTLGVVTYQEQILNIGKYVGNLSWADVTDLRKAMSKSLGAEFFDRYGEKWKIGAREKGIPEEVLTTVWRDLCAYGSWCLSGETRIKNPFKNQYNKSEFFTIKELYESKGLQPGRTQQKWWQLARRQKILMWDGSDLKPAANIDVIYSGLQQTYELLTESGKKIRATAEHEFLTTDGWIKLKDLIPGSFVMTKGERQLSVRKRKTNTGSGRHNWRHIELEGGEFYNGIRGNREKVLSPYTVCQNCYEKMAEETHHKDGDHKNHAIENLLPVCKKCHKKLHREMGQPTPVPWTKGLSLQQDKIISITPFGEEEVYDVSMPAPHHNFLAEDIVVHNCFNKSHAYAYGLVSYWCIWLKAHYPMEFAAATLSHSDSPDKQIKLLRELAVEGIEYIPADAHISTDKWTVGIKNGRKALVGPLSNVKGLGPKMQSAVLSARARGEPLPERALKLLANPKTKIDSLYPIRDRIKELLPDPTVKNIFSTPRNIIDVQTTGQQYEVMVFCVAAEQKPKDENEEINVAKRGGKRLTGPTAALNLRIADDTDVIFAKVGRYEYEAMGKAMVERGRTGKSLYAIKGTVPRDFRMITVKAVRYLGDLEADADVPSGVEGVAGRAEEVAPVREDSAPEDALPAAAE